jgi:hypothetical protein
LLDVQLSEISLVSFPAYPSTTAEARSIGLPARIAGHSSIAISNRYVHPSEDSVLFAMGRLEGGTKVGTVSYRYCRRPLKRMTEKLLKSQGNV